MTSLDDLIRGMDNVKDLNTFDVKLREIEDQISSAVKEGREYSVDQGLKSKLRDKFAVLLRTDPPVSNDKMFKARELTNRLKTVEKQFVPFSNPSRLIAGIESEATSVEGLRNIIGHLSKSTLDGGKVKEELYYNGSYGTVRLNEENIKIIKDKLHEIAERFDTQDEDGAFFKETSGAIDVLFLGIYEYPKFELPPSSPPPPTPFNPYR